MDNKAIIERLSSVLIALNNTEVKGKANLGNISGSIAVLEETCQILSQMAQDKAKSKPESKNTK